MTLKHLKVVRKNERRWYLEEQEKVIFLSLQPDARPEDIAKANNISLEEVIRWMEAYTNGGRSNLRNNRASAREEDLSKELKFFKNLAEAQKREVERLTTGGTQNEK